MKNAAKQVLTILVQHTLLPTVDGCTKMLNLARVRRLWGEKASLCQIDATAKCYNPQNIELYPPLIICREAVLVASENGFINLSHNVYIDAGVQLRAAARGKIEIGHNTFIGPETIINAGDSGVLIGSNVLIAAHCSIISENHVFDDLDKVISEQGTTSQGITIEDNVWIGTRVCILDGVKIGTGSVIAAGAVVTKDALPFSVIGGVPARLIRMRDRQHEPAAT